MDDASESRAGAAALLTLGVVIALACASAIGAVTALVFMALDKPAAVATTTLAGGAIIPGPSKAQEVVARPMRAPQRGECAVTVWKTGMIYCLRNKSDGGIRTMRDGPAVMVQARAEESAR